MSINDQDALTGPKGSDVVDGLRNFTETSNPVTEERQQKTDKYDAWAAAGDRGMGSGEPGVVEAEPGLVESSKIEPLSADGEQPAGGVTSNATTTQASPLDTAINTAKGMYKQVIGENDEKI